jgi:hypothetical protein
MLTFRWLNIKGAQYGLDDELYHMSQAWDLGRFTAPTVIDIQIIEQLFQFLPHSAIVSSIVSSDT